MLLVCILMFKLLDLRFGFDPQSMLLTFNGSPLCVLDDVRPATLLVIVSNNDHNARSRSSYAFSPPALRHGRLIRSTTGLADCLRLFSLLCRV
jgi:hypothetical protein